MVLPYTFDELLSKVNEYVKVEDNEVATFNMAEKKIGGSGSNDDNGKFD